ncbi:cutinase family protein [Corynebacterium breve]|uniref:Cutinase family protein n=1 Tax=Corynebacterium breve TaxID=3049799 RepID=A0ABY8VEI4_9CORY|nr:cutinase family protein [Corynebacterium breve]WIM67507.1 cutinase family protein [Corynebacterium breve]
MRKSLTVAAVVIVLAVIGLGAFQYFNASTEGSLVPGEPEVPEIAEELAQPDWCPDVEFISAPGSWESSAEDDPINPQANQWSYMLSITKPLQEAYTPDHVKVWTLPYTAQFKNINSKEEMSYDDSRNEGASKLKGELGYMHETCPGTKYIIAGFSQGAVIVGDVASEIGQGHGVIPADKVMGAIMVADGRRENGVGVNPGNPVSGVGAEIALEPLERLVQTVVPGASMRGVREGGFGELQDRAFQICAPGDSICDAPYDVGNALERAHEMVGGNDLHSMYATNPDVIPGTTTTQWIIDWSRNAIDTM